MLAICQFINTWRLHVCVEQLNSSLLTSTSEWMCSSPSQGSFPKQEYASMGPFLCEPLQCYNSSLVLIYGALTLLGEVKEKLRQCFFLLNVGKFIQGAGLMCLMWPVQYRQKERLKSQLSLPSLLPLVLEYFITLKIRLASLSLLKVKVTLRLYRRFSIKLWLASNRSDLCSR